MLEKIEKTRMEKLEAFLRLLAMLLLILTACLVRFDTQTKLLYYTVKREATFKNLNALFVLVHIDFVAAAYNLLQLVRSLICSRYKGRLRRSYIFRPWLCFLFDQAAVYIAFSTNSAALSASLIAVTGVESFQWIKLCSRYTRFCFQIGGALLSGYAATLVMFAISSLSAFNLFRLYSSEQFLLLKSS